MKTFESLRNTIGRTSRTHRVLACTLAGLWLLRAFMLPLYPLCDPTEGRYAEIGRQMVVSGDWVVPRIDARAPFLGKPPLSFWATAVSVGLLGPTEFAARLPPYLSMLALAVATVTFGVRFGNTTTGLLAGLLLSTSVMPWVAAGTVFTDPLLALCAGGALMTFYATLMSRTLPQRRNWLGRGFFALLALGVLSKGLVAIVVWVLFRRKSTLVLESLPWLSGTAIFAAIAVPWHVMAEMREPGFLQYYFVGEHFSRFFVKDWSGDRYGSVHDSFPGMIWILALAATFPWCIAVPLALGRRRRSKVEEHAAGMAPDLKWLLAIHALFPATFFTLSSNVVITYVLPGIPAGCLLVGDALSRRSRQGNATGHGAPVPATRRFVPLACIVPAASILVLAFLAPRLTAGKSQRGVVEAIRRIDPAGEMQVVYYKLERPSAGYYLANAPTHADSGEELRAGLHDNTCNLYVVKRGHEDDMQAATRGLPLHLAANVGPFEVYSE